MKFTVTPHRCSQKKDFPNRNFNINLFLKIAKN